MDPKRIRALAASHRDQLLNDTIPFWQKHNPDREHGGFFNLIDRDGSVLCTDKQVWQLGRYTWLMSLLYNGVERRDEWLASARSGANFLARHCFDTDGRMFFEVTREGRPLRKRRYLYAETFAVIAFAEYARATGNKAWLRRAEALYRLFIRYYQNPDLLPPKTFPQTRPAKGHGYAMIGLVTSQLMRAHRPDPLYDTMIDHFMDEILNHFTHPEIEALLETVAPDGSRLEGPEGRCINPGHAIESAWFILNEARRRGDAALTERACRIIDWSLERGWDRQYGGILYFVDCEGKACVQYEHDMKLWWPHQEALYACLLAHHVTGRPKYAAWYEKVFEWSYAHFPDRKYGEWFKYLHRDGSVSHTLKGTRWDTAFHLARMQLYSWRLLEEMAGGAQARVGR
jgi:N-acylglucosamine 2-epimerase